MPQHYNVPPPAIGGESILHVNVHNSCKLLVIRAKSNLIPASIQGEITVTNYDTGAVYGPVTILFSGGGGYGVVSILVDDLPSPYGLYKVCLWEGDEEQVCKPVLIHCNIDCCIAELTNELLACACDCPKCATTLAKAQKIFLLLQSAIATIDLANTTKESTNMGYYIDILDKYKKALELCGSTCGCDC